MEKVRTHIFKSVMLVIGIYDWKPLGSEDVLRSSLYQGSQDIYLTSNT